MKRTIAAIADANRIRLAPHGPHGPAGALANFQFDAATPNFYIQETRVYTGQFEMDPARRARADHPQRLL
jgi:L-alanine-DL-glutamate epimerase-like enolase superfamily enzyme